MDLACPMCRYPLGSGGKRVNTLPPFFPAAISSSTISSKKFSDLSSLINKVAITTAKVTKKFAP
jgi:hypothetical protein